MPHIPPEILEIIIGYYAAWRHFSCAFVSHTFHQIALRYKFKSLIFSGWSWRRFNRVPNFCEAINAGDAHALSLAPLVQELSIIRWSRCGYHDSNGLIQKFEKIIISVLSFQNLTKLSMENCIASQSITEQLGKLVQLQSYCFAMSTMRLKIRHYMMATPVYNPCTRSNVSTTVDTTISFPGIFVSGRKTSVFWRAATCSSPQNSWQPTLLSNSRNYGLPMTSVKIIPCCGIV